MIALKKDRRKRRWRGEESEMPELIHLLPFLLIVLLFQGKVVRRNNRAEHKQNKWNIYPAVKQGFDEEKWSWSLIGRAGNDRRVEGMFKDDF